MLTFVPPSPEVVKKVSAFKQSFFDAGERVIHGGHGLDDVPVEVWCAGPAPSRVPAITLLSYDTELDAVVGVVSMRLYMDCGLVELGGANMGYSIAPPYRRRGYGYRQLQNALRIFRALGNENVMIGADEDNLPSIRLLECVGGVQVARAGRILYYKVNTYGGV